MTKITIMLDDAAAVFYGRLAERLGQPVEQVAADALFRLAGELSLEALHRKKPRQSIDFPE